MATGLDDSARITPRVLAECQALQESTRALAACYGLSVKTVAKWRSRSTTADMPMAPAKPHSVRLLDAEEAMAVEFGCRTLFPLGDLLEHLREVLSQLTRGASHRCLAHLDTIVDSPAIHALRSTRNKQGKRDPVLHQAKKNDQCLFRDEGRIPLPMPAWYIWHSIVGAPANVVDVTQADQMLHGAENVVCANENIGGPRACRACSHLEDRRPRRIT